MEGWGLTLQLELKKLERLVCIHVILLEHLEDARFGDLLGAWRDKKRSEPTQIQFAPVCGRGTRARARSIMAHEYAQATAARRRAPGGHSLASSSRVEGRAHRQMKHPGPRRGFSTDFGLR